MQGMFGIPQPCIAKSTACAVMQQFPTVLDQVSLLFVVEFEDNHVDRLFEIEWTMHERIESHQELSLTAHNAVVNIQT